MAVYEKKWWKRLFAKEEKRKKADPLKDIDAIQEFLAEIGADTKPLLKDLQRLEELEKEFTVAKPGILHVNLETQAGVIESLLERYQFFQNDVDVNGLRMKMIANEFLKRAAKAGMTDLVEEKKKSDKWKLLW